MQTTTTMEARAKAQENIKKLLNRASSFKQEYLSNDQKGAKTLSCPFPLDFNDTKDFMRQNNREIQHKCVNDHAAGILSLKTKVAPKFFAWEEEVASSTEKLSTSSKSLLQDEFETPTNSENYKSEYQSNFQAMIASHSHVFPPNSSSKLLSIEDELKNVDSLLLKASSDEDLNVNKSSKSPARNFPQFTVPPMAGLPSPPRLETPNFYAWRSVPVKPLELFNNEGIMLCYDSIFLNFVDC